MAKPKVALGLLGPTLDKSPPQKRWSKWRPTVDLFRHEELLIDRMELLCERKFASLAELVAADIERVSPETSVRCHEISWADPWDFEEVFGALFDFARSYPFDPENEDYLVHITTGTHVAQICLFLLAESRHLPGRLIQCSPPSRPNKTEPGTFRIIDLDLSKYDKLAARFRVEQYEGLSFLKAGIDTKNKAFNDLIAELEHVAAHSKAPILLTGATGVGKTQLARRIFQLKRQRRLLGGKLVELNCATLRGDGAMSALFGHRRGAFTGAVKDRSGALKEADGGVLFLDEIGELGLDEQAMLLKALEDKVFLPLGHDKEQRSEFQLIAGTNQDLAALVREGRFREDLLARIDLWTFHLPSLKERPEDIEPNLLYELSRIEHESGGRVSMNGQAKKAFLSFATSAEAAWSRNFRDFGAAIERMATMAKGGRIDVPIASREQERLFTTWRGAQPGKTKLASTLLGEDLSSDIDPFELVQLEYVLSVCCRAESLAAAGRELFSASRKKKKSQNDTDRLKKYLARYSLSFDEVRRNLG